MKIDVRQVGDDPVVMMDAIGAEITAGFAQSVLRAAAHAGGRLAEVVHAEFDSRTGQLARSFLPPRFIRQTPTRVTAAAASDLPQAGILDQGGRINPRTVRNLAIPLPWSSIAQNRWPRDWPDEKLKAIKAKGKKWLVEPIGTGKKRRLQWHYVLKPHVDLTPTGYIKKAATKSKLGIAKILGDDTKDAVRKGGKRG